MNARLLRVTLVAMLVVWLGSACSDSSGAKEKDQATADLARVDGGTAECGAGIYPCSPYGTSKGDVVEKLSLLGYEDPEEMCKAHEAKTMDASTLRRISFQDWYLGPSDQTCAAQKRQLLWVMVVAGWCPNCMQEIRSTQADYAKGGVDPRVGVLAVAFETTKSGEPASESFLKDLINAYDLTMPLAMDPTFTMGKYFDKKASPYNMLIDTATMTIYYQQTGGSLETIGQKLSAFFEGR